MGWAKTIAAYFTDHSTVTHVWKLFIFPSKFNMAGARLLSGWSLFASKENLPTNYYSLLFCVSHWLKIWEGVLYLLVTKQFTYLHEQRENSSRIETAALMNLARKRNRQNGVLESKKYTRWSEKQYGVVEIQIKLFKSRTRVELLDPSYSYWEKCSRKEFSSLSFLTLFTNFLSNFPPYLEKNPNFHQALQFSSGFPVIFPK